LKRAFRLPSVSQPGDNIVSEMRDYFL